MHFLQYSNENQCNIIPQEEFEGLVKDVFNVISTNLSRSLGPLGSSATILDGMMTEATKDGYSILNKYCFHNRYKRMIYNLIKAPCTRMNNTVGDGTTTAIVMTNALFNRYEKRKAVFDTMYRLPRQFIKAWDEIIEEVKTRVAAQAVEIDPEDYNTIYHIAYVTSNGNREISDAIAKTYQSAKSPAIKKKDSPTNKSYISPVNGFEFPSNAIDVCYVRNQDLTAEETNVAVMIFDHKIETDVFNSLIVPINNVMRAQNRKLIIVAPSYDDYMCETVLKQYVNYEANQYRKLNLILTQYRIGDLTPYQREDLAVVLRAKTITQDLESTLVNRITEKNVDSVVESIMENSEYDLYHLIGVAAKVLISCKNGSIFNVKDIEDDPDYQDALTRARKELDDVIAHTDYEKQSFAAKVYDARARVLQLEMKNFIYYVGADSELQKQIIEDAVDDVIKCLRSAIRHGVVPGCQLTVMNVCNQMINELIGDADTVEKRDKLPMNVKLKVEILTLIYCALTDVYLQVLHGPDSMGMIKLLPRWQFTNEEGVKELWEEANKKANDIINESIEKNQVFDLETLGFNPNIITSAETDVMVLTAASELVKILISGNQCIFLDSDINESHQDSAEGYM